MDIDKNQDRSLDWDEKIDEPDKGPPIFPDGNYPFTVLNFERSRYEGGDKIPACPMAILILEFDGGQLGTSTIKHNLLLHTKVKGILAQFFKGIGLRKHGEPLVLNFDSILPQLFPRFCSIIASHPEQMRRRSMSPK